MFSHSFATDAQTKAVDLSTSILAAASPQQISACCGAIDSFLRKHTPDQNRWFFSTAFPTLICKLFGFDDSSSARRSVSPNGWIDIVTASNDSELLGKVVNLLSPNGVLMSSIAAVDRLSLVKYVFPNERLPEWVRYMLQNQRDCHALADLCPLFKGRIKGDPIKDSPYQIQLNVFEYYVFWFAYYPVCRGNCGTSHTVSAKRSKRFRLENWANSIPGLTSAKRDRDQQTERSLYTRLLYAYLRTFVPLQDLNAHQPYRSSLLHYSPACDGSALEHAEFFVNTLIHFWLVDNDFLPFPVNVCKSLGLTFPFRSVLGESPPTPGLGELVNVFVKYLSLSSVILPDGSSQVEFSGDRRWRVASSLGSSISWNLCFQRQLYRYILRTFVHCPMESYVKNVSQVFSVWVNYIEPWSTSMKEFIELDSNASKPYESTAKDECEAPSCGYSSNWQGFVLNNYLFYSSLVMHFIGFAHKFLLTDTEVISKMVSKVMSILTSSTELLDLIKNVDVVFHSRPAALTKPLLSHIYRFVPTIREQLQDWECGLCESDADVSFLHESWNNDLRLFSDGEDGGQQLLQLFVLRVESELQALSGDNHAQNVQTVVDSLKAQLRCLFGGSIVKPMAPMLEPAKNMQSCDELFKPRSGSHAVADVRYKGEWMRRPISDDEVAWLARLLIDLSIWLNKTIGLNEGEASCVDPSCSYVELSGDVHNVCGPMETMKVLLCSVIAWIFTLGGSAAQFMRKFGLRVNLRIFASKKVVTVLLVMTIFSLLRKSICGR